MERLEVQKERNEKNNVEVFARIYRLPQVAAMYGVSGATIKRMVKTGKFPSPVSIGTGRAIGWLTKDLRHWEENLKRVQNPEEQK